MLNRIILVFTVVVIAYNINCRCENVAQKLAERVAEKAIEKQTGKKADIDINAKEGKIEIKGDDGTKVSIGEGTDLTGVPPQLIYPGAKTEGCVKTETATEKALSVVFKTGDDVAKVETHYSDGLKGDGWAQKGRWEATQNDEKVVTLNFEKDKSTCTVWIKRGTLDTETAIGVIAREAK